MKLIKILSIPALSVFVISCNNNQIKTDQNLETALDSVSYAAGLKTAFNMKANPNSQDIDKDLFIQGFIHAADSTNVLLDEKEADNVIRTYFAAKQEEQRKKREEEMIKKAEETHGDYKKENEAFIIANKDKEGIITTASGLQYTVLKEGTGAQPTLSDKVRVHYHGTLTDGSVFESSVENNKPAEFRVGQVIKGWQEGLQLMKVGAKYKFFIPQDLAYGYRAKGAKVKPFSALIFEVELLDIITPPKK